MQNISDNTRRIGKRQRAWLRIGFAPSTLYALLPALIRELRKDAELELGLSEMTTLQQIESLKNGRIDIGFGRIRIDDPLIIQEVLNEDPLVAVLPKDHPLAGMALSMTQLAAQPFVLYPANPRPSYADHVLALFVQHGMTVQVGQWANELQTAIGLVAAGLGITLVPASVQQQHRNDIEYSSLLEPSAVSPIILSRRKDDNSPIVRRCLHLITCINDH